MNGTNILDYAMEINKLIIVGNGAEHILKAVHLHHLKLGVGGLGLYNFDKLTL